MMVTPKGFHIDFILSKEVFVMKTKSNALLLSLCAVALVVVSVLGTMAYLTSEDAVVNTFTVGSVEITLDEAKANEDGSLVVGADRVQANTYKLVPGYVYNKDPMVTVLEGSELSYIKMTVTVTKSEELNEIGLDITSTFVGYDSTNWIYKGKTDDETANTSTYEYWYKEAVAAPDADVALDALFDQIKVPGSLTEAQLDEIEDMQIIVNAYAVQAAGFATADAAWTALAE